MVRALTETDQLSFLQGHKVPLPMHAVKGNLANTVCKRKHQHIGGAHVLRGVCTLFPNFMCNAGFSEVHNGDAEHHQCRGRNGWMEGLVRKDESGDGWMDGWVRKDKSGYGQVDGWMDETWISGKEKMVGWIEMDEKTYG